MSADLSRRAMIAATTGVVLGLSTKAFAMESRPKIVLPNMLRPGDKVAMVAPASASNDAADIQKAKTNLERLGVEVVLGRNILENYGYLAGTDQQRADDINEMFRLDSIRAVFAMRGGYGTTRLLHLLDYDLIRDNPKPLVGFSDITGLANAITRKTGLVTFHGPTPASSWGEFDLAGLRRALFQADPIGQCPVTPVPVTPLAATLVPGKAKGHLVGGNLSLLSGVAGSPYAPDTRGAIVFIEEIGEDPYRVDRMLTHLMLAGWFEEAAGVAFGSMKLRANQTPSDDPKDFTMLEVLQDRAKSIGLPCCTGLSFGHIADQVTLPIGVQAELDADAQTLTVTGRAVRL